MADTKNTETSGKRTAIANRELIDADGNALKNTNEGWSAAVGFRYTFLASGSVIEHICGPAGEPTTMFAAFGGLTKIGNIVNGIVNADDYDDSDPIPVCQEWLDELTAKGEWKAPAEGGKGRGPKYDRE